jgi:hypothetical protein
MMQGMPHKSVTGRAEGGPLMIYKGIFGGGESWVLRVSCAATGDMACCLSNTQPCLMAINSVSQPEKVHKWVAEMSTNSTTAK